jgi:hypothetical protein
MRALVPLGGQRRGGSVSKRKGARNEDRSIALLEASGYHCTRSSGSLGAWDIVAIGLTDTVLVQCKTNRWPSLVEMASHEVISRRRRTAASWCIARTTASGCRW